MSFSKDYEKLKSEVERIIADKVATLDKYPEPLLSAVKYSLLDGGKRIRPVLFLHTHKSFCKCETKPSALLVAFAIECIHTYSLIHDDLPAMDNDDFRRGKPTSHKVFGDGIAILAGDALLNLAYESLFEAITLAKDNQPYIQAGKRISHLCSGEGLIGGQTLDIFVSEEGLTSQVLDYIYTNKTGNLIEAALYAGAITGGASDKDIDALSIFAQKFGFAFQIMDDILDFKNGIAHEIKSYVDIHGLESSESALKQIINEAIFALDEVDTDTTFLKECALQSINREF